MITLKSLAEELGLSIGTVSMALNNSPKIHPDTIKRVESLAKKRNYAPNHFGRALQSGKSRIIGCFVSSLQGSFFGELIDSIGKAATLNGFGVMLNIGVDSSIDSYINNMLAQRVEGIIFANVKEEFRNVIPKLEKANIPFVFCSTVKFLDYPTIANDDFFSGVIAGKCMLDNQHKVILIQETTSTERIRGVLSVLENNCSYYFFKDAKSVAALAAKVKATAVISFSDLEAIDVMLALKQANYSIPEDISVLGHDNQGFVSRPEFNLSTVDVQRSNMGKLAVDYIIKRSRGEEVEKTTLLKPAILLRSTVSNAKVN